MASHYESFDYAREKLQRIGEYAALQSEFGAHRAVKEFREKVDRLMEALEKEVISIQPDPVLKAAEPDDYLQILSQCRLGNRKMPVQDLHQRLTGALMGRFAGCLLGVPVEGWPVCRMQMFAKEIGMPFPPETYWLAAERPLELQYRRDRRESYTLSKMDGVAVDDDITYTILGLLILEKYGFDFTTEDVGAYWKEYLPYACTAEDAALNNLKAGVPAGDAALYHNPYIQWIGADIRADGFAFAAAGNPHLAAKMGYQDAYLSHRRNGIYGEMFWAAAEAAAFTVKNPVDAIEIALREIPEHCSLHQDIAWALEVGPSLGDYLQARQAVDSRFAGMHKVHTNNNACLTVFGLMLGGGDFTATISNVVAMGLDNDCTGATAGSVIGAVVGIRGIDPKWTDPFHDQVRTYIRGAESLSIADVVSRFEALISRQPE